MRDALLGRQSCDFDFATPGDPTALARAFAKAVGGRWFLLDRVRCQSRVLVCLEGADRSYDFAPWRGPTLDEDLRLRDFTLNALAWKVEPRFDWRQLYDPLHGSQDLSSGLLRRCSDQSFGDDPLRILRGVRLASQLNLNLEPATEKAMEQGGDGLEHVAPERIRQEMAAIFGSPGLAKANASLERLKLSQRLFGPRPAGGMTPTSELITRFEADISHCLAGEETFGLEPGELLVDGFNRAGLYKLAFLLQSIFREKLPPAVQRWRWSRNGLRLLQDLLGMSEDVAKTLQLLPEIARAKALWVEDLGARPRECLAFLWCRGGGGVELGRRLVGAWTAYEQQLVNGRVPDLVPAVWIQNQLGWPAGPRVGQGLKTVRQAELAGRVFSRQDGEKLLKSNGEKSVDRNGGHPYNRPHVERE